MIINDASKNVTLRTACTRFCQHSLLVVKFYRIVIIQCKLQSVIFVQLSHYYDDIRYDTIR